MNFKIITTVIIGSLLLAEAAIAAKCEFRQDTNDYFSGGLTLRTAWDKNRPYYSAAEEDGKRWLEIKVSYTKHHDFLPTKEELGRAILIPKGAKLEITLSEGEVVELLAMETAQGSTRIRYPYEGGSKNYRRIVSATVRYALSDASIDALSRREVSKVHVTGENKYGEEVWVDLAIPKKGLKQIREAVRCLQKGDSK